MNEHGELPTPVGKIGTAFEVVVIDTEANSQCFCHDTYDQFGPSAASAHGCHPIGDFSGRNQSPAEPLLIWNSLGEHSEERMK